MSSPAEFYNSLPPISKAYGTLCLVATTAYQIGLFQPAYMALIYQLVFSRFQVWRLITNFFFLGKFSINFGIRLLMIARYGVQLEKGPFERRTADFLWMMIFGALSLLVLSAIPLLWTPFLGVSLVFMLLYVWSREFPTANINIYGLVTLKAFYLPWAMLALDVIFGSPILPDLLGIIAGHLYYFLTVLHPLAGGKIMLKTPRWLFGVSSLEGLTRLEVLYHSGGVLFCFIWNMLFWEHSLFIYLIFSVQILLQKTECDRHKLVARLRIGAPTSSRAQPERTTGVAFRGSAQPESTTGVAFRGRSYRLNG